MKRNGSATNVIHVNKDEKAQCDKMKHAKDEQIWVY